jgi:uncharacterized phiE125 gp8 family phage protein
MDSLTSYGLVNLTEPDVEPITLEEAKANSQIDTDDHNDTLTQRIKASRLWLEKATECCLITRQMTWTLDQFPRKRDATGGQKARSGQLVLPRYPVQSIDEIRYIDADGDSQTIDLATIRLRRDSTGRNRLALADWAAWPTTRNTPDAIEIDFTVGFGETQNDVPADWKQPLLLLVAHWFENREAVAVGVVTKEMEFGVNSLLEMLRDPDDDDQFSLE